MTAPDARPAPLVPADTDIAGLSSFLLDVERLFSSELWACSTGEEFKAAVALWGRAWQQKPAGSLPNDDRVLAAFSGAGARWRRVKAMALRGFVLCSDNRFYHQVLCEDVLRAAKSKESRRERTAAATRARQAKNEDKPEPPDGGKKPNENSKTPDRNVGRDDDRNDSRHDDRNVVRHEERHVIVASATCGSLRSPIAEQGIAEERDIPPTPCDPVPRAADGGRSNWNSRKTFDRIEKRCREVLPSSWVCDPLVSPMVRLWSDGLDLEREIVPAILDIVAGTRVPIRTWTLLANRVAERVAALRASRTAEGLPATPPASPPDAEMIDMAPHGRWPEATIRGLVARHRQNPSDWIEAVFGPPPGQPSCKVPPRLLIGEAA